MFYDMAVLVEEQVRAQSHSQALIPIPEPGNETDERIYKVPYNSCIQYMLLALFSVSTSNTVLLVLRVIMVEGGRR